MTANETNPGVLALFPVKFAAATPDVTVNPPPPAGVPVEGLPLTIFTQVVKRDGSREGAVQAVVDPPSVDYLSIALYMTAPGSAEQQLIERKPVAPADQDKPVYFDVFQSLLSDGVHIFRYVVERASGNSAPSTQSWALYHRDLPGGSNVPGTGDHPYLEISLPPELGDPPQIGKEEADKGVPLTVFYPFMHAYDVITLELNRERFTFTVQPGEEGKPYEIVITRAMFEQAGNRPDFAMSYTVESQLNNPTDKRRWSRTIQADVDTQRATLTAPDLSEDPDDQSDDPDTIDLSKVKDFLYVLVHVFSPLWVADDIVRVSYTCTSPAPGTVVTHSVEATVGRLPFTHKLMVPAAKVLSDSKVSVIYEWVRGGRVIGASKAAQAQVIGQSAPDVEVTFTNAPYSVAPKGRVNDINLRLMQAGQPISTKVKLTLPQDTVFADGIGGARDFQTQSDGTVTVSGVIATGTPGTFSLIASSGRDTKTAALTVTAHGPVGRIAVGPSPTGITISSDGRLAYVTGHKLVQVIDTASSTLIRQIPVPTQDVSWEIELSEDGSLAFACDGSGSVSVIDTDRSVLIGNIPASGHPIGIVSSKDGSQLFVSTWNGNSVVVMDAVNLTAVKTIPVGSYPRGIDINRQGSEVYVCNANTIGKSISVIDTRTLTVSRTLPMDIAPYGVAVSRDGMHLFVCGAYDNGQGVIKQINAQSGAQVRNIPVIGYPRGIAVNHAGTQAYCCDRDTNTVSQIDLVSGTVTRTLPVGQGPLMIAISQDDTRALVPCIYDNTVWVISLTSGIGGMAAESQEGLGAMSVASAPRKPIPGDMPGF
jgi:YVTN family beta-propeller protein